GSRACRRAQMWCADIRVRRWVMFEWSRRSWFGLRPLINCTVIEKIGVRVVAVDVEDFGDEPSAWPALNLNDDVKRVADIGLDGAIGKLNPALKNAARESRESLSCGVGVDGRESSRVARV